MKQIFTILAISFMMVSLTNLTANDEIINAFKAGNAAQVAKFFDNTVEISLPEKTNSYSRSQAEMVLKDFFTLNPVKSFNVLHKGQNAGSEYFIGQYISKNHTYRTTVFMKQKDNRQVIQEIRFESN